MESSSDSVVRKFNPGVFQSDEELIRQFVVRQHELQTVLEVLGENIGAPACQHLLVVAPRGRGKTMLLARVAAELRANAAYSEHLMPVRFMEESHEVSCIGDFWLEVLFYLANECASTDPDLAKELKAAHADLATAWQDGNYADRVRATVLMAADQLDKQLVLMVENFQDLCDDVDPDFGWQLRESLQMEPTVMLLATATSRFKALDDAREPFFELFMTIGLEPLDTDECKQLWEVVSGEPVERRDMRPLEILTGGSPRLLTIVAELGLHQSVRRLMERLVALVDDHTEYFRNHLEGLPKTERRVYVAAISLWQPSSTSEIAARSRMDVRLASSMLGRLVERGALVATGGSRKRRYAAAERLYCLYYKIRRKRDGAAVVQMLMRFMSIFYNKTRDLDIYNRLIAEVRHDPMIRKGMIDALKGDRDVLNSAPEAAIAAFDEEIRNKTTEPLEWAQLMVAKGVALYHLTKFDAALEMYEEIIDRFGKDSAPRARKTTAIALFNKGLVVQKLNGAAAIAIYNEIVATYQRDSDMLDVVLGAVINRDSLHVQLGQRHREALTSFTEIVARYGCDDRPFLAKHVAQAMLHGGTLQVMNPNTWKSGLATWRELVARFHESGDPLVRPTVAMTYSKIAALQMTRDLAEEAIATCNEATAYAEDGDTVEVLTRVACAFFVKGLAEHRLGQVDDALKSFDELDDQFGDMVDYNGLTWRWKAIWGRVITYYKAGMDDHGREGLRALYAMLDSGREAALSDLHRLIVDLTAAGVSPDTLADELAADRDKSQALWPLVVALRRCAGQPVRAPVEVMDVADDISRQIEELAAQLTSARQAGLGGKRSGL